MRLTEKMILRRLQILIQKEWFSVALIFGSVLLLTFSARPAFAAGADHAHEPHISDLLPYWVNFLLFVGVLYALLKKPLLVGWKTRVRSIASLVDKYENERLEARRALDDAQARADRVEADVSQLKSEINKDGDNIAEQLLAEARWQAKGIAAQAEDAIVRERILAEQRVQREFVDRVVSRSAELIKAKINPDSDRDLRSAALNGIREMLQ